MSKYDMNWIVFHVIECMSSQKQGEKRIGYMAAALCFHQETPVLMLCTNLIKKDLHSANVSDGALALHTLSQIVNKDLARDLHQDVVTMLNHSNAYIRKRAVITLYKIFLKYPDALGIAFPRLKDRLEDDDPSVVCATVSVICEMAKRNPKAYLPFVPSLFGLLVIGHNWMLIKIVKIFAILAPHEPRLAKKLMKPLKNILEKTRAMSVVYEVVHTIIIGGMIKNEEEGMDEIGQMCLEKLLVFLDQSDQNLKFLGLDALAKLLRIRPSTGANHREVILKCLEDGDISIRRRALELMNTLFNEKSLFGIVKRLIVHLTSSTTLSLSMQERSYRSKVVSVIVTQCAANDYANLSNFEWFISVLCELVQFDGLLRETGTLLRDQILDVCVRVPEVRPHALSCLTAGSTDNLTDFLYAAGWICGEYAQENLQPLAAALVSPSIVVLSPSIQSVYLFAFLKIYSRSGSPLGVSQDALTVFVNSLDLQVQERAILILAIMNENAARPAPTTANPWVETVPWSQRSLSETFSGVLNMVAPQAQSKVPMTIDLETWLVPLLSSDAKLQESPVRPISESVESLIESDGVALDVPFEKLLVGDPQTNQETVSDAASLGSSVLYRPAPKKYTLNTHLDGEEFLETTETKKSPTTPTLEKKRVKKEKKSRSRLGAPSIAPVVFAVFSRPNLQVFASFQHNLRDPIVLTHDVPVSIHIEPPASFQLKYQGETLSSPTIPYQLVRKSANDYFDGSLLFELVLDKECIPISTRLPFQINLVSPKAHRLTQDMFLEIVMNPPHPLDTVIIAKGTGMDIKSVTRQLATRLYLAYQLLENAASLFGLNVQQNLVVGLVKADEAADRGVVVEFKTTEDATFTTWVCQQLVELELKVSI
ncbi:AP-3 complex subunit delta-1 [Kappamyces sp. JEL0680]|nr:AP-3 complex subunit delta-1 [Kappamyces sp. JEL0680]